MYSVSVKVLEIPHFQRYFEYQNDAQLRIAWVSKYTVNAGNIAMFMIYRISFPDIRNWPLY